MNPLDIISRLEVYNRGFDDGFKHALNLVRNTFTAEAAGATEAARSDTPPDEEPAPAHRKAIRRRRRSLTPVEKGILEHVAANPGCTLADLRAAGVIKSPNPVYALIRRRKLRRVEDPKPHLEGKPWVRFHPYANGDANAGH